MTRIAIRDSTDSYNIGFLDNTNGIKYHSADLEVYAQGSAFLDLKYYSKTQIVDVGMRLAFVFRGKDYWMTVTSVSRESEYEYQVEARSLSLEALREVRSSYKASRNMTFKEYLNVFDPEHSIRLNVNTISNRSRKLEWTGEDTILARILSLATKFDAEIEFETELNDDYSLKEFRLNVHALNELGKDRTGIPFRISNSQLKLIKFKSSIDEFYSAIRGTGKDGLSISGLDKKVYDDEKKLLFYTSGGTIYAPQARDKFISITNKKTSDGYIVREFDSTEHETKEALYAYMLGELKKHCEPQIDYTIDGYIDADVNDKVLLIDDKYTTDDLMLTARVNKQKWSLIDKLQGNNRTELSNYVRVYSEIDERLLKIMDDLVDEKTPYVADILTSNGSQFVNKIGTTTLTPSVVKGLENATGLTFEWFKNGEKIANTTNVEVAANDFDNTAVYKYIAYLNNKKVAEKEITLSNVSDGEKGEIGEQGPPGTNGENAYLHIAYANSPDGSVDFSITENVNRTYIGTYTDNSVSQSTNPTAYKWLKIKGDKGDKGDTGEQGIVYSETQPTNPTAGQLWQQPNQPLKRYTGESWVIHQFYADNISAENLTVENGNFTKLVGTSIESGEFINTFTNSPVFESMSSASGTTTLSDGILMSSGTIDETYPFISKFTPTMWNSVVYDESKNPRKIISATYDGVYLYDYDRNIGGTLTVDMLYDTGWIECPIRVGTGRIKVRRYMGRYMLWFDSYSWNGASNRPGEHVTILPEGFRTGRAQMVYGPKWSLEHNDSEKFQMNADGSIHKISNISQWPLQGFVEYF